jgi:outer membrane receptor protein involved in Fe transport
MPPFTALCGLISLVLAGIAPPVDGRVIDARTGAPIAGAEIAIVGHRGSVRSDDAGRFRWPVAPQMPVDVIVVLPDGRVARSIRLTTLDATRDLTLSLDAIVTELITVTGAAPTIDAAPGAATTLITGADLQLRHPLTISQVLDIVPGMSSISEGQSAVPAIRGLARGRTLILVDGSRASTERRAGANASFLDPGAISTIEIARGPGSVAYGSDAFGGVIAARTRGPDYSAKMHARFTGTIGTGTPEQSGDLEASTGYGSGGVLVAFRAREFEDYHAPSGVVPNSGWRDSGARVRWEHLKAAGRWSIGWQSDFGRALGRPRSDSDVIRATSPFEDSHRLTGSYERASFGGFRNLRFDALAGRSRQRTDQDRLPTPTRPRSIERADLSSREAQVRLTGERAIGRARVHVGADVQGRYGFEALDTTVSYNLADAVTSTTTTVSIESAHRTGVGFFAESDAQVARRVRISGGLRVDAVRNTNVGGFFGDRSVSNAALAGLFAVTIAPAKRLTLTGQVARGFRDPILSDRFYRGPVGRGFIEGNPDLRPETSLQFDLTARYVAGPFRLAAACYHYRITDLIERYAARETLFLFRNRGRAELRGVEVEGQATLPRGFALEATAETSRGRDAVDGTPIDDVAPATGSVTIRHAVSARVASYVRIKAVGSHGAAGPSEVPTRRHTIADAGVSWNVARHLALRGAMRNLLNRAYESSAGPRWVWAPGRHGSVTIVVRY